MKSSALAAATVPFQLVRSAAYHLLSIFLFTKADIKTTLIPVGFFAYLTAPLCTQSRTSNGLQAMFWLFMHLLQFNLANQSLSVKEDEINNPDRPLPSGRVTVETAQLCRILVVPACLALSLAYSPLIFFISVFYAIITFLYNEMKGGAYYLPRNLINGCGFAVFHSGTTLIASCNRHQCDSIQLTAVSLSIVIIITTIQSQDFDDIEGDLLMNRRTLPIVYPRFSRYTPMVALVGWSLILSSVWELDQVLTAAFVGFSTFVGWRFFFLRTVPEDHISYWLYNLWVTIAMSLPGYYRQIHKDHQPTYVDTRGLFENFKLYN